MKLPLKWLKEYIDYEITHEQFVEKMMWRGFEVADVLPELPDVSGVVAGRVLKVSQHPDAQKLHICHVDAGEGSPRTIVCGAPNVYEGMLAPVALPGAKLPGGIEIQPTVMRGVESAGMLCSGKELGLTDADYPGSEVYGLLDIQGEHSPGEPIAKALDMNDVIFDIELTANRPDCLSIIGICREVASALGKPFKEPVLRQISGEGSSADYASVTVLNTELCPRYAARIVTDIKIEPSPRWMQKKLRSVGLRPINNIVDITNYVMVEYGHPMHAFDLACVADAHIVVRNAYENETVRTLDSKDRAVDPSMLLIADPKKGVGIAGVMGGENSEIKPETKAVLFEAAVFKNSNIRATARKLRHITDAAARFIKGVEPVSAKKALDRAMELIVEFDAGRIIGDTIDVCAVNLENREIDVSVTNINRTLSTELTGNEMAEMLSTIQISAKVSGDNLHISLPHYRTDIESGIESDWDIAEEVGRIYGYYNIEPTLMRGDTFRGSLTPQFRLDDEIKDRLVGVGAYEMYNYNFTGPAAIDALRLPEDDEKRQTVRIINPFGEDQSLMRTTLYIGMLKSAALNLNRRTGQGRFFEVGNVHFDNNEELAEERKMIGLTFFGEGEDFFTLKGAIEELLEGLGIADLRFVRGGGPYLHPGRSALIYSATKYIGELGETHPDVTKAFDIDSRICMAELRFDALYKQQTRSRTYAALPRYPVVQRDLAVLVEECETAETLKFAIERASNLPAGVLVEQAQLFDVFRGGTVPAGKKSMAYSLTLRAEDRTLNEEEISASVSAILGSLKNAGAALRE